MADTGKDAKLFQRGKVQELRAELQLDKKDKGWVRKKTTLKKIIANATLGNDMSPLFNDVVACMNIQVLEIKKMVCECNIIVVLFSILTSSTDPLYLDLYLINYGRSKPDQVPDAIPGFLSVS